MNAIRPTASGVRLASRMGSLAPSAVREILKVAGRPDVISFAGGLPAPELFPTEAIRDAFSEVLSTQGGTALQYSVTEGDPQLRAWIAERLSRLGTPTTPEQLLITSGSQQGIDLCAKVLLDAGDAVVVESPTYLAALQAFSAYQVRMVPVPSDDEGMQVDALEEVLRRERPAMIYLVPDFQNPKGTTLALSRRHRLVELAARYRVPIVEDDPYGELRFRGHALPTLAALGAEAGACVLRLGTFSKTLAPGLRIAWLHAPLEILRHLTVSKQSADLHTATLAQRATAKLLERFDYDGHLRTIRRTYGARCDAMIDALGRHLPAGSRWTEPDGGLFLWLQLPEGLRDDELFREAISQKVAIVPGSSFFADGRSKRFARLNYSNQPLEKIEEGVRRLGEAMGRLVRPPLTSGAELPASMS